MIPHLNNGDIIATTTMWVGQNYLLIFLAICGPKYTTLGHCVSETLKFAVPFSNILLKFENICNKVAHSKVEI